MITLVNPTLPYGFAKRHGVILLDVGDEALGDCSQQQYALLKGRMDVV